MISASIVQHILLFFVTTAQGHALHNRHVEDQGLQEQRLDGQHFLGQEPGEVEKTTTQLFMTSSRGTVKATSSIAVTTSAMPTMPNTTTLDELSDWELARQKYLAQTTTEPPPKKNSRSVLEVHLAVSGFCTACLWSDLLPLHR
mmetsp:Transcript_48993/g.85268  ORF Transcript_48993/g.85268 Transcript_48993/m.85268 type:complete len:144 (-) Transcript_48993:496-927(-)